MRRFTIALILLLSLLLLSAVPALAEQNGVYYTVRGGDTLSSIAAYYGVSQQSIVNANNLYNPNHVFAGQVLFIPFGTYHPPAYSDPVYRPTYTVQPGDTLFKIARRYGVSVSQLAQLNQIYNINVLYAGRVLVLPDGVQTQPPVVHPPTGQPFRYYVQPGDTLSRIARRYGVTLHALIAANNLYNPNHIYTGQALIIP